MATQLEGIARRSRVYAALVALALAVAIIVVITQASSVWSTRTVPPGRPASVQASLSAKELRRLSQQSSHLPDGCRIKYGRSAQPTSRRGQIATASPRR